MWPGGAMNSLKKRRRIWLICASALALAAATTVIGFAMRDGIQFFRTPSQALHGDLDEKETFRIGGMVEEGSLRRAGVTLLFRITDGAQSVPVSYGGLVPDLFAEGEGVIATGRFSAGEFRATEVLARHDEDCMPRELADMGLE